MQRLSEEKDWFLSQVTHELRTPLNAILGYAQLLRAGRLSPIQTGHVDSVIGAARHLRDILSDLLDISSIQSGRLRMSITPVSVADVCREAHALISPEAAARGIEVRVEPFPDVLHVAADRQRLLQVIVNLLSNAVKYNRRGGSVIVSADPMPPQVCVKVVDTGVGIPAEKLGRLFEPFERLGMDRTRIEGTGLGLALSRHLVEAMRGSIHAESRPGTGSTFLVRLPAAAASVRGLVGSRPAPVRAAPHDAVQRILYIEDNLDNLRLMTEVLEGSAFQVSLITARQGSIGIELAQRYTPHLILLDLRLPDMHGDEVLQRLKQDEVAATIPVIVITADPTPAMADRLLRHGARACLTKPYDIEGFLAMVDDVLAQRHARRITASSSSP